MQNGYVAYAQSGYCQFLSPYIRCNDRVMVYSDKAGVGVECVKESEGAENALWLSEDPIYMYMAIFATCSSSERYSWVFNIRRFLANGFCDRKTKARG